MKTTKSYKYRIYPNEKQKEQFAKTFGCVRFYWNHLVAEFNKYSSDYKPQYKSATKLRDEFSWMQEISCVALQQKQRDFNETKKQFFNKQRKIAIGKMKFKKKASDQSFRMTNQNFILLENKLKITKIGLVKIKIDRRPPAGSRHLSVTISKTNLNEYYASICYSIEEEPKIKQTTQNIGIDLGVSSLLTLSDGLQFVNPKLFRENQSELKKLQQHLSRKKHGSNRYAKAKLKVAKLHKKIARQRDWLLHNISRYIVTNYDEIGIEDLSVASMIKGKKNRGLNKAISDASMSKLKFYISYKQLEYGKQVHLLGRYEASTKECFECSNKQTMTLSDREFCCTSCGVIRHRDLNAALVIQKKTIGGINPILQTWSNIKIHPFVGVSNVA